MKEPQKPQNPSETVKMLPHQPQPQLEHVVSMLENAKDLLDQHKTPEKTLPKVSMQTEIRYVGYVNNYFQKQELLYSKKRWMSNF